MKFSQRIQNVNPSMTLAIDAKAKEMKARGEDVIGFGTGEPDFNTPERIKQAGEPRAETFWITGRTVLQDFLTL